MSVCQTSVKLSQGHELLSKIATTSLNLYVRSFTTMSIAKIALADLLMRTAATNGSWTLRISEQHQDVCASVLRLCCRELAGHVSQIGWQNKRSRKSRTSIMSNETMSSEGNILISRPGGGRNETMSSEGNNLIFMVNGTVSSTVVLAQQLL